MSVLVMMVLDFFKKPSDVKKHQGEHICTLIFEYGTCAK